MDKLLEQLKKHEGFKSNYYQCTADKKTIGYGHCVDTNPFSHFQLKLLRRSEFDEKPMKKFEAETILLSDVMDVKRNLYNFVFWNELNIARQAVLINMTFTLGYEGFKKFKNTIKQISDKDYQKAALEMLDSKWANQVGKEKGQRAYELSEQMRTGEWQ